MELDDKVSRFMKVYTSLPIDERKLTVMVIDNNPINWDRAMFEIEGKTELSQKILEKLINLSII